MKKYYHVSRFCHSASLRIDNRPLSDWYEDFGSPRLSVSTSLGQCLAANYFSGITSYYEIKSNDAVKAEVWDSFLTNEHWLRSGKMKRSGHFKPSLLEDIYSEVFKYHALYNKTGTNYAVRIALLWRSATALSDIDLSSYASKLCDRFKINPLDCSEWDEAYEKIKAI